MFDFDKFKKAEPMQFFLQKPNGDIVCELNGIDDSSASTSMPVNNQYEIEFDVVRFIDVHNPETNEVEKVQTNGYDKIVYGMYLYCPQLGSLKMDYPERNFDGEKEYLHISASSVESELEDKDLYDTQINTGDTVVSLEYLIDLEGTGEELLDAKGLPYDYISFHCTYANELRKIKDKYDDGDYIDQTSIDELVAYSKLIKRLVDKPTRDEKGKVVENTVYMAFTVEDKQVTKVTLQNDFNQRVIDLINFYEKNWDKFDFITTVLKWANCDWSVGFVDEKFHNKHYPFVIENTNVYAFLTQDVSQYAECIFDFDKYRKKINIIDPEKLGEESGLIVDKTNFLNTFEVSCNEDALYTRFHVQNSNGLNIAYVNFGSNIITDLSYFMNVTDDEGRRIFVTDELAEKYMLYEKDREVARQPYIELTRKFNQLIMDINELQNRLPNDDLNKHWGSYSVEELEKYLTQYNNLFAALITMCKNDYPDSVDDYTGLIIESKIEDTPYYADYVAYKNIIAQIDYAIKHGYEYEKIDPEDELNAFKTNWKLYGINELNNKIKVYENTMNVLVDNGSVLVNEDKSPIPWEQIPDKSKYNKDEYEIASGEYQKAFNNVKGATEQRDILQAELEHKRTEQKEIQEKRDIIVFNVELENYHRSELIAALPECEFENPSKDGKFTKAEIREIYLLYFDNSYSNENCQILSIDDVVTLVDEEIELFNLAKEQLSIDSQPQLTFTADIDNLLCQEQFKDYRFYPGNYLLVQYYDDYYMHLRLSNIEFNPRIPSDPISVEFTNYIKSNSKRSDVSHLLSLSSGGGKSGRSSGGSGSGNFGDVDLTISNTMLSKLLNADAFAAKVSDVILDTLKVKTFNARNIIVGEGSDITEIDGEKITTGMIRSKSNKENPNNGTNINLDNDSVMIGGSQGIRYDNSTHKVTFGDNVVLNWNSIEGKPDIGTGDSGQTITDEYITQIARNSITTDLINSRYIATDEGGQLGGFNLSKRKFIGYGYDKATDENTNEIVAITTHVVENGESRNTYVIAVGTPNEAGYSSCDFRVRYDGRVYANDILSKGELYISTGANVFGEGGISSEGVNYSKIIWHDSIQSINLGLSNSAKLQFIPGQNYFNMYGEAICDAIQTDSIKIKSGNTSSNNYVEAIGTYSANDRKISNIGISEQYIRFWLPSQDEFLLPRGTSDIRLKENISSTRINALQTINKIQMHSFDWKSSGKHQNIGFIADELYEQDKNLVLCDEENPDSIKSVNTFYLQGLEVKAIQELSEENKKLKQENKKLKDRLIAVEAFLTQFGFEPSKDEQQ